ncbi:MULTISPECIES: hypothetical protein [unclassified Streptomyces]|uniref:hypothetical protein n=1 Tax=unclassified Streptomyces TaxID=2593676 RepID=UPI0022AF7381|nr:MULTISPECIES: hypothetical protein [unclassified Streptomyces]MCZ4097298.1 hypothetical protein [Streptomyces sp. H39-C1]MCZ4120602.1 hypothetical protein [Streptomyces sp. H39-S7]
MDDYCNVAYAYVPQLGFTRLQWNGNGGAKVSRVFTGQSEQLCDGCRTIPLVQDIDLTELVRSVGYCCDHQLFGVMVDLDVTDIQWVPESVYHRSRHGQDLNLSPYDLLALLYMGTKWDRWNLEVASYEAPMWWRATLSVRNPFDDEQWLEPVVIDAGHVRTMLRTAESLMPIDVPAAELLRALMSADHRGVGDAMRAVRPSSADLILQYAIFGKAVFHG